MFSFFKLQKWHFSLKKFHLWCKSEKLTSKKVIITTRMMIFEIAQFDQNALFAARIGFFMFHDLRLGERKHLRNHQNASFFIAFSFFVQNSRSVHWSNRHSGPCGVKIWKSWKWVFASKILGGHKISTPMFFSRYNFWDFVGQISGLKNDKTSFRKRPKWRPTVIHSLRHSSRSQYSQSHSQNEPVAPAPA